MSDIEVLKAVVHTTQVGINDLSERSHGAQATNPGVDPNRIDVDSCNPASGERKGDHVGPPDAIIDRPPAGYCLIMVGTLVKLHG